MNLLATFSKTVIAGAVALASLIGLQHPAVVQKAEAPVLGAYSTAAGGTYRLQTSLGTTDTIIRLSSFKDPRNDVPLTMSYMNTSIAYGTLDPQQPTRSELVSFTGITQNSDGTASLTGVTRGLLGVYPYTASTTLRKTHAGQSIFILSDAPQVFNEFAAKKNDETITGSWTFASTTVGGLATFSNIGTSTVGGPITFNGSTTHNAVTQFNASTTFSLVPVSATQPTLSTQVANKAYVDGVAIAGSPDADTTTKGISEEATGSEIVAGTAVGGTGARLFVNPSSLLSSGVLASQTATTSIVAGIFEGAYNGTTVGGPVVASTTNGYVGRFAIPVKITASKIVVGNLDPTNAGTIVISLFSADGQRKIMTATSSVAVTGSPYAKRISFATTTIPQGVYYVAVVADSAVSTPIATYVPLQPFMEVAGSPILAGRITGVSAGVMPASFSPVTGIATTSTDTAIRFRLEE